MQTNKPLLFSSWESAKLKLSNRIMISPMCIYQAEADGLVSDKHLVHYGQYALGGAGLIITEAVAVEERGRISGWDLGLWADEQIKPLRKIVAFAQEQGSKIGIQLGHSGLKGSTRPPWEGNGFLDESDAERNAKPWQTVGPCEDLLPTDWPAPKVLTTQEIAEVVDAWGDAAARADAAGFDVLEIHGAHGYLISEFLSPLSNRRKDGYGGEEGRTRLACEVVESVRANWPDDKPLFFRLSVIDGVDVGWSIDDSINFSKQLKRMGVDLIDCSSGGFKVERDRVIPRKLGFQVYLSKAVKAGANIPTASVGLITEPGQAEAILQSGQADLIAIGRTALNNPYWPRHAAQYFGVDDKFENWPDQYGWWLERWARTLSRCEDG